MTVLGGLQRKNVSVVSFAEAVSIPMTVLGGLQPVKQYLLDTLIHKFQYR